MLTTCITRLHPPQIFHPALPRWSRLKWQHRHHYTKPCQLPIRNYHYPQNPGRERTRATQRAQGILEAEEAESLKQAVDKEERRAGPNGGICSPIHHSSSGLINQAAKQQLTKELETMKSSKSTSVESWMVKKSLCRSMPPDSRKRRLQPKRGSQSAKWLS